MAVVRRPDMRPWGGGALTIPPNSVNAWIQLAMWEMWMGMLVCLSSASASAHRHVTQPHPRHSGFHELLRTPAGGTAVRAHRLPRRHVEHGFRRARAG